MADSVEDRSEAPSKPKRVRISNTLAEKKKYVDQALKLRETLGLSWREVARHLGLSASKLVVWCEKKDIIDSHVSYNPSSNSATTIKKQNPVMSIMEQILVSLVEDHAKCSFPLKKEEVKNEARQLLYNIELQCFKGDTTKTSKFYGSDGWIQRFAKRKNLRTMSTYTASELVDNQRVSTFMEEFNDIASQYNPNLIFHFDECGLVWNINKFKNSRQEHKNNVTLLLGSNSTGKDKLHPLLINSFENPRALKGVDRSISNLGVIFKSSKDALMTRELFYEWFTTYFVTHVKKIAEREKTEAKALLVLDNAPVHLQELYHPDYPNIRVLIMPPTTSIVLQPLNKDIVKSFKILYVKYLIKLAKNETKKEGKTWSSINEKLNTPHIIDFLHGLMNLRHAIYLIGEAWSQVSRTTLHRAWGKLWPGMAPVQWDDDLSKPSNYSNYKEQFFERNIPEQLLPIISDIEPQAVIDYYTLGSENLVFLRSQLNIKEPEEEPEVVPEGVKGKLLVNMDHNDYTCNYESMSVMPIVAEIEQNDEVSSSSLNQLVDLKSVLRDEDSDDDEECPRKRKLLKIANYIIKELERPCRPGSTCCGSGKKCNQN